MIELRVNGKKFKYFSNVSISLGIDTIASTFNFSGFFDQSTEEIIKPLKYAPCEIWAVDNEAGINEQLITGTIINTALSIQRQVRLTGVSGYSKTGVLEDVNIPTELYPLQYDGLSLTQITQRICDYFGIELVVFENAKEEANKVIELTKAEPGQTVKDFLSTIAKDKGITLTHNNLGQLLLYKILNVTEPKISINENDMGVISIALTPNGQTVHSSITVIQQASTDNQNESQTTVNSPFVSNVKRPLVKMLKHGKGVDTKTAANQIAATQAKAFPIIIELEGWTFNNKIVRAGFYIELTAPSIFVETTKLVLQRVEFKQDQKTGKKQILTAVLPCVYTGVLPNKTLFV